MVSVSYAFGPNPVPARVRLTCNACFSEKVVVIPIRITRCDQGHLAVVTDEPDVLQAWGDSHWEPRAQIA